MFTTAFTLLFSVKLFLKCNYFIMEWVEINKEEKAGAKKKILTTWPNKNFSKTQFSAFQEFEM